MIATAVPACNNANATSFEPRTLVPTTVDDTVAFVNVRLIRMTSTTIEDAATVVVVNDRIVAAGTQVTLPAHGTVIEGNGRYLMPGLVDMHVHVRSADMNAYVQYGVTSVRNMWGYPSLAFTPRAPDGGILPVRTGPSTYSASPGLDGTPPSWPGTQILLNAADADRLIDSLAPDKWSFLKVYNRLSPSVYDSILASARRHGIRVVGHVPFAVSVEHALDAGQASIEHLTGYDNALAGGRGALGWANADLSRADALATHTRDAGTWNCPTLVVLNTIGSSADRATRDRASDRRHAFVGRLHAAGARLLAGTDAGIDVTEPGASLHDELGEFVASGLTPYEALASATRDAAEFLEKSDVFGTVAAGMRADLVLLRANPLADIRATRSIDGVMVRGQWFAPEE